MQVVLEVENNGASVLVGQYGRFYNAFRFAPTAFPNDTDMTIHCRAFSDIVPMVTI